jgi:hypothetical protein
MKVKAHCNRPPIPFGHKCGPKKMRVKGPYQQPPFPWANENENKMSIPNPKYRIVGNISQRCNRKIQEEVS